MIFPGSILGTEIVYINNKFIVIPTDLTIIMIGL